MASIPGELIPTALVTAQDLVDPAMRAAVSRLCPQMARVAGYHHGWLDQEGRPTLGKGGKALRPALALLGAQAAGGPTQAGVVGAVAVELMHSFSLLHDDIMDRDTERRHRPTAWVVFGDTAAILAGDALLVEAVRVLLDYPGHGPAAAARLLEDAQRLVGGQASDVEFERRNDVTLNECLDMAGDKTGALIASACSVGAILAGASAPFVANMAQFGKHLGIAFQLVDDLLGIWGGPELTGKPALSDLRSRKKSVPVVAALQAGTPESERLGQLYLGTAPLAEEDLNRVAELIERAGGRAWTEQEAINQLAAARECLKALSTPSGVQAEFLEIARFITDRKHHSISIPAPNHRSS
ncbi:MAG: polyprenyl synthetase family protein [Frankia sp.]